MPQIITFASRFASVIILVFVCVERSSNKSVVGNYTYGRRMDFVVSKHKPAIMSPNMGDMI